MERERKRERERERERERFGFKMIYKGRDIITPISCKIYCVYIPHTDVGFFLGGVK